MRHDPKQSKWLIFRAKLKNQRWTRNEIKEDIREGVSLRRSKSLIGDVIHLKEDELLLFYLELCCGEEIWSAQLLRYRRGHHWQDKIEIVTLWARFSMLAYSETR